MKSSASKYSPPPAPKLHGFALLLITCFTALVANAAIQQINVLPGRPDAATWVVANAVSPGYCSFPTGFAIDVDVGGTIVKKAMFRWYTGGDPTPAGQTYIAKSTNGGYTFAAGAVSPIDFLNCIKRRNGTILSLPFSISNYVYYTSTDNLATPFVANTGGTFSPSMLCDMGILEENDGSLYVVGYTSGYSKISKSTNGGVNWSNAGLANIADINEGGAGLNYSETTIERCVNGSWLAVMRVDSEQNMRYARSTDKGVTWTAPALLPGLTTNGKAPLLKLMPNGILVLGYGEGATQPNGRHYKIAFSADGNGTSWTNATTVLAAVSNVSENSGYCALWPMGAHRIMYIGDTGTSWSSYSGGYAAGNFKEWGKIIDLVPTHVNRVDLKSRVAAGTVTITTDMTYSNATHPEARSSGAYDGSSDYWSGAFRSGTSGSYTIDLQQVYQLNAVGTCLHYDNAQSATVERSTDGLTWTTIKTYSNVAHRAMDYTAITPVSARYIRVNVSGAGPLVCLNEVEVYTTTDTFENNALGIPGNPHGVIPPGYAWNGTSATQYGFAVRDIKTSSAGYESERSYQMWDGSSTWRCGIKKQVTATASKTFEFRIKPTAYSATGGAIQFILLTGTNGVSAFQMAVFPDGGIKYYNGSAWVATTGTGSPAGPNTVPLNTWSTIKVVATLPTTTAPITVNGVAKGSAGKIGSPTTISGFAFGSGGTTPYGDAALFDDITIN